MYDDCGILYQQSTLTGTSLQFCLFGLMVPITLCKREDNESKLVSNASLVLFRRYSFMFDSPALGIISLQVTLRLAAGGFVCLSI